MKILLLITTMAFLFVGANAQTGTRPRVVKTVEVEAVGYRNFHATAYAHKGRTASGEKVRQGIIAADPRVLPIGTKVHIQGLGYFIVKDTGGAIKGNRIDIWFPTYNQAVKFGRRKVQLRII